MWFSLLPLCVWNLKPATRITGTFLPSFFSASVNLSFPPFSTSRLYLQVSISSAALPDRWYNIWYIDWIIDCWMSEGVCAWWLTRTVPTQYYNMMMRNAMCLLSYASWSRRLVANSAQQTWKYYCRYTYTSHIYVNGLENSCLFIVNDMK